LMNLKELNNKALLICIPASVSWESYLKELKACEDWSNELNFKVRCLPKVQCKSCYLVHKGVIKGWMTVTGYESKKFTCSTTGKEWDGNFIKRSGPFHRCNPVEYPSFRGFRYINPSELGL